jgi:hypothetical protein
MFFVICSRNGSDFLVGKGETQKAAQVVVDAFAKQDGDAITFTKGGKSFDVQLKPTLVERKEVAEPEPKTGDSE